MSGGYIYYLIEDTFAISLECVQRRETSSKSVFCPMYLCYVDSLSM